MILGQPPAMVFQRIQSAGAMMPASRMPPPNCLRNRRARWMNASSPTSAEPIGAPKPFEKQTLTESKCAAYSRSERPSPRMRSTAARRQCRRSPASRALAATARSAPSAKCFPRPVVRVLDAQELGQRKC